LLGTWRKRGTGEFSTFIREREKKKTKGLEKGERRTWAGKATSQRKEKAKKKYHGSH